MSIEIKVYLSDEQNDDDLCFHCVVNSKDDYDLFFDLNDTYEGIMLEFLNGSFELDYLNNNETYDKGTYSLSDNTYEQNIEFFINFLNEFYGLNAIRSQFDLFSHFGVRLVGAGFRGRAESPMLEHSQYNAMNSIHSIKNSLFISANNTDYMGEDIYIKKAHGSLILTLESTKQYNEPIEFIKEIYSDIENKEINPFKYLTEDKRTRYQSIIKNLNDLNNQKRLKEFFIIIEGEELEITQREYLREQTKSIYNEEVTLRGYYEGYKKGSNSFEISVEGQGKYYCHLNNLERTEYSQFERVYEVLKNINIFDSSIIVKVKGQRIKPKTINVTDVEV